MSRRLVVIHCLLFLFAYAASLAMLKPHFANANSLQSTLAPMMPIVDKAMHSTRMFNGETTKVQSSAPVTQPIAVSTATAAELPPLPPVAIPVDSTNVQNAYMSLDVVVQSDELSENRLAAVNQLHAMAANGDPGGRIQESLRMATADGDPRVAEAANAAYREVKALAEARH